MEDEMSTLVSLETYETNAVHIGTQQKSSDMMRFIEKIREDGLYLIDINITDSRIRTIAKFLENYDSDRILVVSARQYGQKPARKFAEVIGAKSITGRFIPGTLTNPKLPTYIEPVSSTSASERPFMLVAADPQDNVPLPLVFST